MDLDEMKEFFHRLNEHKEYLKYCVYGLSYKWYQIYDKKCYEGEDTKKMLHQEYLTQSGLYKNFEPNTMVY